MSPFPGEGLLSNIFHLFQKPHLLDSLSSFPSVLRFAALELKVLLSCLLKITILSCQIFAA